jgi:Arc/MetJ-type ribon-helix-helix transcriptional regulator
LQHWQVKVCEHYSHLFISESELIRSALRQLAAIQGENEGLEGVDVFAGEEHLRGVSVEYDGALISLRAGAVDVEIQAFPFVVNFIRL